MPEMKKDIDYDGCLNLVGAVIRQALRDYAIIKPKVKDYRAYLKRPNRLKQRGGFYAARLHDYESAESFLFSTRLEYFLRLMDIDAKEVSEFIRKCATGNVKRFDINYRDRVDDSEIYKNEQSEDI